MISSSYRSKNELLDLENIKVHFILLFCETALPILSDPEPILSYLRSH